MEDDKDEDLWYKEMELNSKNVSGNGLTGRLVGQDDNFKLCMGSEKIEDHSNQSEVRLPKVVES